MYQFLTKYGQAAAFGLGSALIVIYLLFALPNAADFELMPKESQYASGIFNFGLTSAVVLVILAAVGMVLFGLVQIFGNIKGSLLGLLAFAALVAIYLISYSAAPGEAANPQVAEAIAKFEDNQGVDFTAANLKFVSGGLTTALLLAGLAVAALVITGIRNFFK
ncbi:MAG: hypothetical protein KDC54_17075 [Lewinella sp.]|nr:hypothetical protein [Lewinella sp.]